MSTATSAPASPASTPPATSSTAWTRSAMRWAKAAWLRRRSGMIWRRGSRSGATARSEAELDQVNVTNFAAHRLGLKAHFHRKIGFVVKFFLHPPIVFPGPQDALLVGWIL